MANDGFVSTTPASFRLRWDVFLSFRGEDTRHGITEKLYNLLNEEGVRVFRDDDGLNRGDEISQRLLEAIEDSAASIVILSQTYASSHWCLEELARICDLGRLILPVFYRVDPSHVRRQRGPFEEAFGSHEIRFGRNSVMQWRRALEKVGGLAGYVFDANKSNEEEKDLIRVLLRDTVKKVINTSLKVASYAVGLDTRMTELINLLDVKSKGIKILRLHGMGGIGKTTLARAIYNKIFGHFDCRCFISDVRERSNQEDGLVSLQKFLISHLCASPDNVVLSENDVNANALTIRQIIHEKNVLLVVDDVDEENQLNALGIKVKWQNDRCIRIIVTRRNRGVLNEDYMNLFYEVRELHFDQALELFSHHAFGKKKPTGEFLDLSKRIVSLTGKLPLALEVFGSFMWEKREIKEWEEALKKLRDIRPNKLQGVLKISFDGLDKENQRIFLDIACLFVKMGMKREGIIEVLKGCDFNAVTAIRHLEEKCLIKFTQDDALWMHDQLRDMGRQIVQEESFVDPGRRSRLWDREEIMTVLKNHKGTSNIEGIVMDVSTSGKEVVLCTEPFESMVNLRLLQINHVKLEGKYELLPHELKWLQWQGCALKTLPSDFCLEKLAVLDLSKSKIQRVWSTYSNKVAQNLMVMNLRGCPHLDSLPDLSGHEKLQKIVLQNCVKLISIHESVGSLKSLCHLDVTGCSNLIEFPRDVSGMKNLETLVLNDCSNLKELPEGIGSMKSLKELYLDNTGIQQLPESIYRLEQLEKLSLCGCERIKHLPRHVRNLVSLKELHLDQSALENLPDSIGSLENLETLSLISCESLTAIPDTVGNLKLLKDLSIMGSAITELPNSIGSLSYLKCLFVGGNKLSKLPDSIQGLASIVELDMDWISIRDLPSQIGALRLLEKLEMRNCSSLESLPESMGSLFALTCLNIFNANFDKLPESIGMLENLIELRLNKCRRLCKLPSSIGNLKSLRHLYMEETAVTNLPERFGMLSSLMVLKMAKKLSTQEQSKSLALLPTSFSNLSSLKELDAHAWRISGEIPDDFEKLSALEILNLGSNDFSKLPSSLRGLSLLKKLLLPRCEKLESLSPLPSSLEELNLADCISLENVSDLSNLESLEDLNLTNCEKLVDIPGLQSLKSLRTLYMSNCKTCSSAAKERLSKVYLKRLRNLSMPGSKIPDWFSQDAVRFTSHKNRDLKGVIIAVAISLNHHIHDESRYQLPAVVDIIAQVFNGDKVICTAALHLLGVPKTNEDHVHLCRYSAYHPLVSVLKDGFKIQVTKRNPPCVTGVELKKAGIYLVYEDDDDYEGKEESLDESQQSVSERLAKFFSSLELDDGVHQSSFERKEGMEEPQVQTKEDKRQPSCRSYFVIAFGFLLLLLSWLFQGSWLMEELQVQIEEDKRQPSCRNYFVIVLTFLLLLLSWLFLRLELW